MVENLELHSRYLEFNGKKIKFPYKVYDVVLYDDKIIVSFSFNDLKEAEPDSQFWRAVWCFNLNGEVLWKVESPYYVDPATGEKVTCEDGEGTIQGVLYRKDLNKLVVFGRMGYEVDPETGKLGEIVYRER